MKTKKIIIILLLVVSIISFTTLAVHAKINPDDYKPGDLSLSSSGSAMKTAKNIVGAVSMVAAIIFIGTIVVLGIKYMTASLEERANYKKTMIPVLIGGAMIFGISTILSIVLDMVPQAIS